MSSLAHRRKHAAQAKKSIEPSEGTLRALEWITWVGIYGGLLLPLIHFNNIAYPYVFPKMVYFQTLIGLTFPAWLLLAYHKPEYRLTYSRMFGALLLWFLVLALSTVAGASPWRSFFSTHERMTGLFALLHFLAWLLMSAATLKQPGQWRRLFETQIAIGFVASCITFVLPYHPEWVGQLASDLGGDRLSGLFGNPIFSASYQNFNVFFVLLLWPEASWQRRRWYMLVLAACVGSLIVAGSRGPMLGLIVGLIVAGSAFVAWGGHRRLLKRAALALAVTAAAYLCFLLFAAHARQLEPFWIQHENLRHFFEFKVDTSRQRLWAAAWDGFLARPLFGWGLLNYEIIFDVYYRPIFHVMGINDEPHNWLLSVVTETGLLGLAAFAAIWVTYFRSIVQAKARQKLTPASAAALLGVGACHFIQNVFAFDSPVTNLTSFLIFAVVVAHSGVESNPGASEVVAVTRLHAHLRAPLALVPLLALGVVLFGSVIPAYTSTCATQATIAFNNGDRETFLHTMTRSQKLSTPYREDQLRLSIQCVLQMIRKGRFGTWNRSGEAISLVEQFAKQEFAHVPNHNRLTRAYGRFLSAAGIALNDRQLLAKADQTLLQNLRESPKRQTYIMDYARFLAELGKVQEAEPYYKRAVALEPSVGEPQWEYGKFQWLYLKRPDEGARLMANSYDKWPPREDAFCPRNSMEWQQLAQVCARTGERTKLKSIAEALRVALLPNDRPTDVHLAIAGYMEQSGLELERNRVLELARQRNPKASAFIDPILRGEVSLKAQREALAAQQRAAAARKSGNSAGSPPHHADGLALAQRP